MAKQAILTVGVSASGKTIWAEAFCNENPDYQLLCRDNFRRQLWTSCFETPFTWQGWRKVRYLESEVNHRFKERLDYWVKQESSLVIANTHLNPKTRNGLKDYLEEQGYQVELKLFPIQFEDAVKFDLDREYPVGYEVIARQFIQWNEFTKTRYIPDQSKPKAIIVDIDGTLTIIGKHRGPFDWDKVGYDIPKPVIIELVRRYSLDHQIIILTGREEIARDETVTWLNNHNISWHKLLMRPDNDFRRGDILKEEIFWSEIAPYYNVQFALEDTPKIIRLWQSIGVEVLALGNPYIEKTWSYYS